MSVKKWHQLAEEKSAVDQQTQDIHQKFRMNKINKKFGQLSGEELFKPITKRLDEKSSTTTQEVEESPDYAMDEFDRTNPFGDEFRPDAPTPELTPPPSPSPELTPPPSPSPEPTPPPSPSPEPTSPRPYEDVDGDDFPPPPPPLMEEKSKRKEWGMPGPVEPEYPHESTLLQTVNQLITKYGDDPNYIVKSKKSPLHGKTVEELKKIRDEIYEKRRPTQPLSKQLQQGKQSLKSTPPSKREIPPTSLETSLKEALESRRPFVEPSDDEEDSSEQDWETEGSGFASADKLIHRLYVSLGSIKAGNSSIKLKNQVLYLLDSVVELGTIDKKQKKKIISNIYSNDVLRSST